MNKKYTPRFKASIGNEIIESDQVLKPVIKASIELTTKGKSASFKVRHSLHSMKRSAQRGIDNELIILAQIYGRCFFKQGMVYYVVHDRDIPEDMDHEVAERLSKLVAIFNEDETELVTAYRCKNGPRHIRLKTKFLYKAS